MAAVLPIRSEVISLGFFGRESHDRPCAATRLVTWFQRFVGKTRYDPNIRSTEAALLPRHGGYHSLLGGDQVVEIHNVRADVDLNPVHVAAKLIVMRVGVR